MFDLLVVLVVGLSTAFAALRGGVREVSTLLALAVAGGLTLLLIDPVVGATGQTGSFFGTAIAAVLLIGVFFVLAHIAFHVGLERMPLKGNARLYDRVGGGVFGFARGLVLIGLGYLGYTYYLDEARQPEEVRNAITRPVAAGMAQWFEGFAPEEAQIENMNGAAASDEEVDPSVSGYDRGDRNTLSEIVTTVTTTDSASAGASPAGETQSAAEGDLIADILQEEDSQ